MRKLFVLAFALLLIAGSVCLIPRQIVNAQQKVSDGQRLAMFSKPSVVRIIDGYIGKVFWSRTNQSYDVSYGGSGSGSFIDPSGYIATNAHVTSVTKDGEDKAREKLFVQFIQLLQQALQKQGRSLSRDDVSTIANEVRVQVTNHIHNVILPDGSSFPFEIKSFGAPVGEGKDISIIKIEVKNAPVLKIGDSDKVQLQDHITVLGYPGAADTDLLAAKSALEASITDGKVSAKKNAQDGSPILQVSAPSTHGNSGGPVLNDNGEIVGLLTFRGDTVNGQEVQGFNFVVASSTLKEFVKQAGATNEEGLVDKRYREGLELYWKEYYKPALEKFEEVRRLFPQHSEVTKLITVTQQSISEGKDKSGTSWVLLLILGVVGILVIGGGVAAVLLLKKKKAPAVAGSQPYAPRPPQFQPQQPFQPQPPQGQRPPMQQPMPPQFQQPMPAGSQPARTVILSSQSPGQPSATSAFGAIVWQTGPLTGRRFDITPQGFFIGRDGNAAQVVIEDPRVSSRHAWVGVRNGRAAIVDSGSTNGTFLNSVASGRIQEISLNPGDTIIISEADVARFTYQN